MAIQAFRVGAGGTDTPSDVKTGFAFPTGVDQYMTFEFPIGTDVQVTAGKTLYITHIRINQSVGANFDIGYGDTGVANGASAPTNYVEIVTSFEAVTVQDDFDVIIPIPAGKYPCVRTTAGDAGVYFEGIEVTN